MRKSPLAIVMAVLAAAVLLSLDWLSGLAYHQAHRPWPSPGAALAFNAILFGTVLYSIPAFCMPLNWRSGFMDIWPYLWAITMLVYAICALVATWLMPGILPFRVA